MVEKGLKYLYENKYFKTLTKQVERLEVWKKMGEKEKARTNKVGLVTLLGH